MTWRTPSSFKWLLVKHSRLQREVTMLVRQSADSDRQAAEHRRLLEEAKRNLQAIECGAGFS